VFHEKRITRVLETRATSQKEIMHYASVRQPQGAALADSRLVPLAT
jgi:predicted XRE-type DNA-binding protein